MVLSPAASFLRSRARPSTSAACNHYFCSLHESLNQLTDSHKLPLVFDSCVRQGSPTLAFMTPRRSLASSSKKPQPPVRHSSITQPRRRGHEQQHIDRTMAPTSGSSPRPRPPPEQRSSPVLGSIPLQTTLPRPDPGDSSYVTRSLCQGRHTGLSGGTIQQLENRQKYFDA